MKESREEIREKILKESREEIAETVKKLIELKEKIIGLVNNRLATYKHNLHMTELEKALNIVKRELGEPLYPVDNGANTIQAFQNIQINFYDA